MQMMMMMSVLMMMIYAMYISMRRRCLPHGAYARLRFIETRNIAITNFSQ